MSWPGEQGRVDAPEGAEIPVSPACAYARHPRARVGDAGHVIVVAFVKESELDVPDRERAIADAARAAHDYFLFVSD